MDSDNLSFNSSNRFSSFSTGTEQRFSRISLRSASDDKYLTVRIQKRTSSLLHSRINAEYSLSNAIKLIEKLRSPDENVICDILREFEQLPRFLSLYVVTIY